MSDTYGCIVKEGLVAGVVDYGFNYVMPSYQLSSSGQFSAPVNDAILIGGGIMIGKAARKLINDSANLLPSALTDASGSENPVVDPAVSVGGVFALNQYTSLGSPNNSFVQMGAKTLAVGYVAKTITKTFLPDGQVRAS